MIADHARYRAFLIADGVFPDKTGREYVLRRIFRRAVRHGKLLGITEPFMHHVCNAVIDEMRAAYPELAERRSVITEVALEKEKRFRATLDRGLALLDDEFARMTAAGGKRVSGKATFTLYDTFGFPDDLTEIIAAERGFGVDRMGYEQEMAAAQEKGEYAGSSQEAIAPIWKTMAGKLKTSFLGYDGRGTTGDGLLLAIVVDGKRVAHVGAGAKVSLVFDQTPFYAESGGQIGDTGVVATADGSVRVRVDDTVKPSPDVFVLIGELEKGTLSEGMNVTFVFDDDRRESIRANHSATHLLNHALHTVLGDHVTQKGSLVTADRLRFDFAHFSPMTDAQIRQVDDLVNAEIRRNVDSIVETLPIDQAKQRGAVAMFGEKYGDVVRIVKIGHDSLEFCGGTHVRRAGDIGLFKIVSEAGVAQGVRRIDEVRGAGALEVFAPARRPSSAPRASA